MFRRVVVSLASLTSIAVVASTTFLAIGCGDDPAPEAPVVPAPPPAAEDPAFQPGAPEAPVNAPICAQSAGEYVADRVPSNVLFLFDRSGSMHIQLQNKKTRWQETKAGFFELLASLPSSTGAGLMLFPQGDAPVNAWCGIDANVNDVRCKANWPEPTDASRCDSTKYAPNVDSALLSAAQIKSMQDQVTASDASFYWGTPLASAITAAIDAQRASKLPGAKSVILLTDGNPTSCGDSGISNDIENVVKAAAKGIEASGGNAEVVRTFVIGLVDSNRQAAKAEKLSPIAVAGGTKRTAACESNDSCFYKLADATFASDLKKVFEEISLQAFDCTFNLPEQTASTDPSSIAVQISSNGGTYSIARDTAHAAGWDYLPGPNSTQIQLYGQACADMKNETAKLRVVLGCKTIIDPPASSPK